MCTRTFSQGHSRWLIGLLIVLLSQSALAHRLLMPSAQVLVAPGQQQTFELGVGNDADTAKVLEVRAYLRSNAAVWDVDLSQQYQLTSLDSGCATVTVSGTAYSFWLSVRFASLNPGQTRQCRFVVSRSADSNDGLGLAVCAGEPDFWSGCVPQHLDIGSIVANRIELTREPGDVPRGAPYLLRLTIRNLSNQTLPQRVVTTECLEFNGGIFLSPTFTLDSEISGGCPAAYGELCLNFTGQNFDAYGFSVAETAPGASSSCLIRVTPVEGPGRSARVGTNLHYVSDHATTRSGERLFAPSQSVPRIPLGTRIQPVPLAKSTSVVLAMLLLMIGWATLAGSRRSVF